MNSPAVVAGAANGHAVGDPINSSADRGVTEKTCRRLVSRGRIKPKTGLGMGCGGKEDNSRRPGLQSNVPTPQQRTRAWISGSSAGRTMCEEEEAGGKWGSIRGRSRMGDGTTLRGIVGNIVKRVSTTRLWNPDKKGGSGGDGKKRVRSP